MSQDHNEHPSVSPEGWPERTPEEVEVNQRARDLLGSIERTKTWLREQLTGRSSVSDTLSEMSPEEYAEFVREAKEAEEPCALCGLVILCGGCPSADPRCPQYPSHI